MRDTIKQLVREGLLNRKKRVKEVDDEQDGEKKQGNTDNHESNTKKDYTDIQHALDKDKNPTGPSHVGIMKSMGIEDDKNGVNRSLFGKKVHQDRNEDGGLYQFNDDELATIRGIIPK